METVEVHYAEKICHLYFHSIVSSKINNTHFFPMAHFHEISLGYISKPLIQMVQLRMKSVLSLFVAILEHGRAILDKFRKKEWYHGFRRWKQFEIAEFMVWDWQKVLFIETVITDDLTRACRFARLFNWVS